jgi:VWFA-related protein
MRTISIVVIWCSIFPWIGTSTQTSAPPRQTFATQTVARVIDVVVRDKKGSPITGLQRGDFQLTENGSVQEILGFSAVTPGNPPTVPAASGLPAKVVGSSAATVATVVQSPRLTTAIVFERLTPESRQPAKVAALRMLDGEDRPDESFGVFVLDLSLNTLQPFTSDRISLRKAVAFASTIATAHYEPNRIGIAASEQVPGPDLAEATENAFKELTRIQQGYATTNAIEALATAMAAIPGRKTILYFSDGLPVQHDANKVRLDEAIATANRYNVAVYPVDAVGLRVHSQELANGQALRSAVLSDMQVAGKDGSDLAGGGAAGVAEYIQRSGSTSAVFNRIASGTGGFVVEDTNDLRRGVAAIDADRHFYYLLIYSPTNQNLDGTWRAVSVTVPNRKVTVRARSGYIATVDRR